jgi:UDP-N-acetylglucosamine 2-epimerase (non-hydrolysing)
MVFIVYGTTGELIKLIPLITELKRKNQCYTVAFVQQEEQLQKFFKAYPHIPKPDLWLVNGYRYRDLDKFPQMAVWLIKARLAFARHKKTIIAAAHKNRSKNIVLVHGDTVTTVFGGYVAKKLKFKLGHIEAGLRSFNIFHPFPEELDRRIVSKMAKVHFAPGTVPTENLRNARVKGEIIDTKINTVYDSIKFAARQDPAVDLGKLPSKYGIVSIHRNELLINKKVFTQTLKTLSEYAEKRHMVFLQHPITLARIESLGLSHLLEDRFTYVPKLDYFSFMKLLNGADFVVTDSGGLQEECTYLNIPCMVHRKATERMEGLDEGLVQLSYYNDTTLRNFLENPDALRQKHPVKPKSPTGVILKYLKDNGHINT